MTGRVGLSTYSYFWQHTKGGLTVEQMLADTAAQRGEVFQICDYPAIEDFDDGRLAALAVQAREKGIVVELGTRGTSPGHLHRYLELARKLDAPLVRSMLLKTESTAEDDLRAALPDYERHGVTLALETYEQVSTVDLVALVERMDHPNLGICLDPANCVAALEHPDDVVDRCAPYVKNLHCKDFRFTRADKQVGFQLVSTKLGAGQLDLDRMFNAIRPDERGISQIVEHWIPWQGDQTLEREREWTAHNLEYLKRRRTWTSR
jgi:3-oxoisoapionate decarboxylase